MQSPTEIPIAGGDSIDLMAGVLRFLRSVRARLYIVVLMLIFTGSLGAVYYVTADRKFESKAQLLILQTGGDTIEVEGTRTNS